MNQGVKIMCSYFSFNDMADYMEKLLNELDDIIYDIQRELMYDDDDEEFIEPKQKVQELREWLEKLRK